MSKEFHVFTHQDTNHEQAFVFEIERHDTDEYIEFRDLWLITSQNNGEVRTRIKLDKIIESIVNTHGGNIDDSKVDIIIDLFKDLLPKDKQMELYTDLGEQELSKVSVEDLIDSSDYAVIVEQAERIENEKNIIRTKPRI